MLFFIHIIKPVEMAILKYAPGSSVIRKSALGHTFQNTTKFNAEKPVAKIVHHRSESQLDRMAIFIYLSRIWRGLNPNVKKSWSDFSTAIPQPTKFDPGKKLAAFQNFVRRNYYLIPKQMIILT